jgi:hypothetical protein
MLFRVFFAVVAVVLVAKACTPDTRVKPPVVETRVDTGPSDLCLATKETYEFMFKNGTLEDAAEAALRVKEACDL